MMKKLFKSKMFQLTLLMSLVMLLSSCDNYCDETVYGTRDDGSTYEECIIYN